MKTLKSTKKEKNFWCYSSFIAIFAEIFNLTFSNIMKERIVFLDYLKTLTIIMVIIYHSHAYEAMVMPIFLSVCVIFFLAVNGNLMLMKLNALTSTVI